MTTPLTEIPVEQLPAESELTDAQLVLEVRGGDMRMFAVVMRRYNRRLFRVARAITAHDAEAEDAVQAAFVAAHRKLATLKDPGALGGWLTRIVVREALQVARKQSRGRELERLLESGPIRSSQAIETPERRTQRREIVALIERNVDTLPENLRIVFMWREVEDMSTREVAELLDVSPEVVRVRLHRARAALRQRIQEQLDVPATELFEFAGERCDRIVAGVWARLLASLH